MTAGSKPPRKRIAYTLLIVAALAAAAYLFSTHRGRSAEARSGDTASTEQTTMQGAGETSASEGESNPSHAGGSHPVASAAIVRKPLPPSNAAVAGVFDELFERARHGDAHAACWLGSRLQRCKMARLSADRARAMEENAVRNIGPQTDPAPTIALMERFAARNNEGCDDLDDTQLEQAFALQWQAANAIPALRMKAVLLPALDRNRVLEHFDEWGEYRKKAIPWLEEAAQHGDPDALIVLARVYGDHRPLSAIPPPFRIHDDARFVMYSDLMARYGIQFEAAQADLDKARARLSAEEQARVASEVDARYRPDFPHLDDTQVRAILGKSMGPPTTPEECEVDGTPSQL